MILRYDSQSDKVFTEEVLAIGEPKTDASLRSQVRRLEAAFGIKFSMHEFNREIKNIGL